jgi:hypothetical protein
MKLYILEDTQDYYTDVLVGVFSSKELADKAIVGYGSPWYLEITEVELDAVSEYYIENHGVPS